jgi:hypothetical protein
VPEASLELVSSTMLIAKGASTSFTTAPAGSVWAQLSAGISRSDSPAGPDVSFTHSSFVLHGSLEWGITDRLQLNLLAPGVAYRFGEPGDLEAVPHLFMAGFSLLGKSTGGTTFHYLLGADLVARKWVSFEGSLNAQITAFSWGVIGSPLESYGYDLGEPPKHGPNRWRVGGSLGWSQTFAGALTVNLGIAASDAFAFGATRGYVDPEARLSFGSVQSVGGRPLSLLELHLSQTFSLELHAWTSVGASTGSVESTVLAGVSKAF